MRNKIVLGLLAVGIVSAGIYLYAKGLPSTPGAVTETPKEPIVLGYNAAMSKNSVANFGISARQGFEIAIDDINAAGGILGRPVKGVALDDEGNPELSKKNMEQLINVEKAVAVIGPANSGNALHWLDFAQESETTVISVIATATEITQKFAQRPRNFIFRISSLDKEQVRMLIAWALHRTNGGKIAILHDSTPYGVQGEKDVREVLSRWGKAPSFVGSFDKTAPESAYVDLLKKAQDSGADAVMIYSLVDSSSALVKASTKIPDFKPILLGTAANAIDLWNVAGPESTNLYFSAVIADAEDPRVADLERKIQERTGAPSPAITTSGNAYDAVLLLKKAIEDAGSADKVAVRDALEEVQDVQGVTRLYVKPFSKDDHEGVEARDFIVGHWVDGVRELLHDEVRDLEIR